MSKDSPIPSCSDSYSNQPEKLDPCVNCGFVPQLTLQKETIYTSAVRWRVCCACSRVYAPTKASVISKWKAHNLRMQVAQMRKELLKYNVMQISAHSGLSLNTLYRIRNGGGCRDCVRCALLETMEKIDKENQK